MSVQELSSDWSVVDVGETCVATKLRDKLHEKLPSVAAPLAKCRSARFEFKSKDAILHSFQQQIEIENNRCCSGVVAPLIIRITIS